MLREKGVCGKGPLSPVFHTCSAVQVLKYSLPLLQVVYSPTQNNIETCAPRWPNCSPLAHLGEKQPKINPPLLM